MDDKEKLKLMFPWGSSDFFKANLEHAIKTRGKIQDPNPKHYEAIPLDETVFGKEEGMGRVTVRYRLCRVRPLDADNATGSTKDLTDGLCRCGLIPGDDPTQITLIVEQEKVDHYSEERTVVEIEWP